MGADYLTAQSGVIGSMLISPEIIGEVVTALRPADFSGPLPQQAFQAIRDLFLAEEEVDPLTVLHKMGGEDQERRAYLMGVMDSTPTAANFRAYLAIVQEQARVRRLQELGQALAGVQNLEEAGQLVSRAGDLLADRRGVQGVAMDQALERFFDSLSQKPDYLTWGFPFLDEGLYAKQGSLIILGGFPSDGKTALALQMAYHLAQNKRVGFFSLETDEDTLFARLFSSVSRVDGGKVKRRQLSDQDYEAMVGKVQQVRERKLSLIRANSMAVKDIQAYAMARKLDVIFIDYLQLIVPGGGKSRYEKVTQISMDLHNMAQGNGIAVVALSQLSREEKGNPNPRPPRLSDLRESGQIEADADIVLLLYREEPGLLRSRRILSVAKNKEGKTGRVPLLFDGETQTFREDTARGGGEGGETC